MVAYSAAVAYRTRRRYGGVVPPPSRVYTSQAAYRNNMVYTGLGHLAESDTAALVDAAVLTASITPVDTGSGFEGYWDKLYQQALDYTTAKLYGGVGVPFVILPIGVAPDAEVPSIVEGTANIAQFAADVSAIVYETEIQGTALEDSDTSTGTDGQADVSFALSDVAVTVEGAPVLTATLNVSMLITALEAAGIALVADSDIGRGGDGGTDYMIDELYTSSSWYTSAGDWASIGIEATGDTGAGQDIDTGGDRFTVEADQATVHIAVMGPYGSLARKLDFLAVDRYRARPYRGRRLR